MIILVTNTTKQKIRCTFLGWHLQVTSVRSGSLGCGSQEQSSSEHKLGDGSPFCDKPGLINKEHNTAINRYRLVFAITPFLHCFDATESKS